MFPAYREFVRAVDTTNTVIGSLDIAAALGLLSLKGKTLTAPIRTIFPDLPRGRFLQTGGGVEAALSRSGHELAAMAIPVVISAYERLAKEVLELLRQHGRCALSANAIRLQGLDRLHATLETSGITQPAQDGALWEFARLVRNRIVHGSGTSGDLRAVYLALGAGRREWVRLAGREFLDVTIGNKLTLTLGEALGVVGLIRRMGHTLNTQLQGQLTPADWVMLLIADYRANTPEHSNDWTCSPAR
jgi:hypothetical protein